VHNNPISTLKIGETAVEEQNFNLTKYFCNFSLFFLWASGLVTFKYLFILI
jgi:hypothetical protein